MKSAEEIMEILDAYDLTGSFRDAGELAGCSHHTVKRYVEAREKLAALVASGLIDPASSEEVLAAVPMFGWEVFSTTVISRKTFREMLNSFGDKWAIVSMSADGRCSDILDTKERIGKLRALRVGEVIARLF